MREIVLALGSNVSGRWDTPIETLRRSLRELADAGLAPVDVSPLYATAPVGAPGQNDYVNAVVCVRTNRAPAEVLRIVKRLETASGRRPAQRWSSRPLDIDIIGDGGRSIGWSLPRSPGGRALDRSARASANQPGRAPAGLVVPHPRMHERAFVLVPLADIRPHWHHAVTGLSAQSLLARVAPRPGTVRLLARDWAAPLPRVTPKRRSGTPALCRAQS